MNVRRVAVIVRKELTDAFRDKRAIYSLLIGSLVGPLLVTFMLRSIAQQQRGAQAIKIPVVGQKNAPLLVDWLGQQGGVEIVDGPADPEKAVRERVEDMVLVIPKDFAEDFDRAIPASVQLVSDTAQTASQAKVRRLRLLLQRYSAEIGSLRLVVRGVSPSIVNTLSIEDVEVSSAQQRAAPIFNLIPLFVILAAFTSAIQIATDSTAGERERGSLESLLLNPVPRMEIVIGKWLSAAISSAGGMTITLVLVTLALLLVPFEDLGIRFTFAPAQMGRLLLTVLPMALLAPALQVYLASFARTFKEAQQYMGYLIMVPMLGLMGGVVFPRAVGPWMAPIPILGQFELATEIIGGEAPSALAFGLAALSTFALAALFVWLTGRLFRSERLIVGR
ncbi:MAG TPA: ABC transporter permease subunit [Terriglobia bacterium]|nr:ABC transporter permease subunit [Terriglobia bacterium]